MEFFWPTNNQWKMVKTFREQISETLSTKERSNLLRKMKISNGNRLTIVVWMMEKIERVVDHQWIHTLDLVLTSTRKLFREKFLMKENKTDFLFDSILLNKKRQENFSFDFFDITDFVIRSRRCSSIENERISLAKSIMTSNHQITKQTVDSN